MKEIVDRDEKTEEKFGIEKKAIDHFKKNGEIYKSEIIEKYSTRRGSINLFSRRLARFMQRSSSFINWKNWKIFLS